jgi:hypothetical protein
MQLALRAAGARTVRRRDAAPTPCKLLACPAFPAQRELKPPLYCTGRLLGQKTHRAGWAERAERMAVLMAAY